MKSYKARGIVLNTIKYGDTSIVVQMLTDISGRQSYMVQGVRSGSGKGSKLALFQPMFALEFEGLQSPKAELHRLRDTRLGLLLQSVPYDVRKSTIALFMAEVLYRLVGESEANPLLFDFVWGSIEALDRLKAGVANFHLWFLANLSRFLGFSPGNEYVVGGWFDMQEGVFTPVMPLHDLMLGREEAELFARLLDMHVEQIDSLALNRTRRVAMLDGLVRYYTLHLAGIRKVRSLEILQEVF